MIQIENNHLPPIVNDQADDKDIFTFDRCRVDVEIADANSNDHILTLDEFKTFVQLHTRGEFDFQHRKGILPIVMVFNSYACKCTLNLFERNDCCLKDNAHISLTNKEEEQLFCGSINKAMSVALKRSFR